MRAKAPPAKRSEKSDGKGDGDENDYNLFPRVFYLPTPRERGNKDPGSGWSRVLVPNLSSWEGSHFIKVLSPLLFVTSYYKPALWATMENSLSIS